VPSRALTGGVGDADSPGSDVSLECRVLCVQPSGDAPERNRPTSAVEHAARPPQPLGEGVKVKEVGVGARTRTHAEAASLWRRHGRGRAPGAANVAGIDGSEAEGGACEQQQLKQQQQLQQQQQRARSHFDEEVGTDDCAKRRRVAEAPGDGAECGHASGLDRSFYGDRSCRNSRASSGTVGRRSGGSGHVVQEVEGDSLGPPARWRIRGKTSCSRPYGEMNTFNKSTLAATGPVALDGAAADGGDSSATKPPGS
jgi:hypothetical protein